MPRAQIVCHECKPGLIHKLVILHAGKDTLILCAGNWERLPSWLKDGFKEAKKLMKRREIVGEIREHLEAQS